MNLTTEQRIAELEALFFKANGDEIRTKEIVGRILKGLTLPPCFEQKNCSAEETARARELVRQIQAN